MHRRQVLCALVVVVALTAGCMNTPRPTPQPPSGDVDADDGASVETPTPNRFAVPDWSTRAVDNTTVVDLQVRNEADTERGVRVTITRRIDDRTIRGSTDLVLGANRTASTEIILDVPYERFWEGSNMDFEFTELPADA
jgi:uncharacterized lipoprotein